MAHVTLSHTLTNGTPEDASQVQENFIDITDQVNGNLDYTNLSESAAIKGTQLSTTYKIPTDRLAADCVTKDILKDDVTSGAPDAAVNSSAHIKDGIVTKAKISGKLSLAQMDVSVTTVTGDSATQLYGQLGGIVPFLYSDGTNYHVKLLVTTWTYSAGTMFFSQDTSIISFGSSVPVAGKTVLGIHLSACSWSIVNKKATVTANIVWAPLT